jgi:hypothetical protein
MTPKQLSARSYAAYERLDGMSMIDKAAIIDAMSVLYRHEIQTQAAAQAQRPIDPMTEGTIRVHQFPDVIKDEEQ